VSGRWPGWRTLPGIELAPLAERAREQGAPCMYDSYVWGADEHYVTSCRWQVDADGAVTLPSDPGWEAVVEDGMLTGFRGRVSGTVERLVQVTSVVVPDGDPPWSPALTVRLPPDQIGLFRRGDTMGDGMNLEEGEACASVTVGYVGADGSFTSVVWGITPESALSVIALIRERHGEPSAEFTVASDHAEALRAGVADTLGAHAIYTCAHEEAS